MKDKHALAKRGAKVLGIDSQPVPNKNSSYNGNTRVIRLTYQEHPDYVPLLKEAYRLWGEIEQEKLRQALGKTSTYRLRCRFVFVPIRMYRLVRTDSCVLTRMYRSSKFQHEPQKRELEREYVFKTWKNASR